MIEYLEGFTVARVIMLASLTLCAYLFYKSYNRHRTEIYVGLKGKDGNWQAIELAAWYWFKFFPYIFFLTWLMPILDVKLTDQHVNLIITMWTATNTIFAVAVAMTKRNGNGNKTHERREDEKGIRGKDQEISG